MYEDHRYGREHDAELGKESRLNATWGRDEFKVLAHSPCPRSSPPPFGLFAVAIHKKQEAKLSLG